MRKSFFILLFAIPVFSSAQPADSLQAMNAGWKTTLRGMQTLSGWAVLNIGSSLAFSNNHSQLGYFHQMNGLWNTVNLGLGGLGWYRSYRTLQKPSLEWRSSDLLKMQKTFKVNGFIDFGYIGTGIGLLALSDRFNNASMAKGYGTSLILQGGFLLLFDWAMYYLVKRTRMLFRPG